MEVTEIYLMLLLVHNNGSNRDLSRDFSVLSSRQFFFSDQFSVIYNYFIYYIYIVSWANLKRVTERNETK
jgi:hypothetical protein